MTTLIIHLLDKKNSRIVPVELEGCESFERGYEQAADIARRDYTVTGFFELAGITQKQFVLIDDSH